MHDANSTRKPHLITCVGVEHESELLPHFIEHYLSLGIARQRFHILLNAIANESRRLGQARGLIAKYGLAEPDIWIAPYTSETMWQQRRALQAARVPSSDWVVSADVDEFHDYGMPLPELIALCERYDADCVQGVFIDRVARTGDLLSVTDGASIWSQFPVQADIQNHLVARASAGRYYGTVKMMLFQARIFPGRGGHQPIESGRAPRYLLARELAEFPAIGEASFRFAVPFRVHHFKWRDTLIAGLKRRLTTPGVSAAGKAYGQALLDYFQQRDAIALDAMPTTTAPDEGDPRRGVARLRRLDRRYRIGHYVRRRLRKLRRRVAR